MKFQYLEHFGEIVDFGLCFTKKSAILRFGHVYDIVVTSYVECLYLFKYVWKEETVWLLDIYMGGSVFKFTVGCLPPPFGKPCYRKQLGKTRVIVLIFFMRKRKMENVRNLRRVFFSMSSILSSFKVRVFASNFEC